MKRILLLMFFLMPCNFYAAQGKSGAEASGGRYAAVDIAGGDASPRQKKSCGGLFKGCCSKIWKPLTVFALLGSGIALVATNNTVIQCNQDMQSWRGQNLNHAQNMTGKCWSLEAARCGERVVSSSTYCPLADSGFQAEGLFHHEKASTFRASLPKVSFGGYEVGVRQRPCPENCAK